MTIQPGTQLGAYEILAQLDAGRMCRGANQFTWNRI